MALESTTSPTRPGISHPEPTQSLCESSPNVKPQRSPERFTYHGSCDNFFRPSRAIAHDTCVVSDFRIQIVGGDDRLTKSDQLANGNLMLPRFRDMINTSHMGFRR